MHEEDSRVSPAAQLGLVVLVFVVYLPALSCDFVYDDHKLIVSRPPPRTLGDVAAVFTQRQTANLPYYRPVTWLTLDLQSLMHGRSASAFHAVNVALAAVAVVLVAWLLSWQAFGMSPAAAVAAAAVFAVHPVTACVVYPVCSGRETLVSAVAMLAAMVSWLRGGRRWRLTSLALLAVALLSREQAVVLPGLFVLADALRLSADPPRSARGWSARYAPIAIVLVAYIAVRGALFGGSGEHTAAIIDHPAGPLWSMAYALQTLLVPFGELVYEPSRTVWLSWPRLVVALVVATAVAAVAARRGPQERRRLLFWAGWGLLVLLPTANILGQQTRFAERYGFLAVAAGLALVAGAASRLATSPNRRRVTIATTVVVVLICAGLGWSRGRSYRTNRSFLEQWIHTDRESAQAHLVLAALELKEGHERAGERALRRVLELEPGYAEAHNGLGRLLRGREEHAAAEIEFRAAIAIRSDFAEAHSNLGYVLARQKMPADAARACRRALEIDDELVEALSTLGRVEMQLGQLGEAERHLLKAVALDPRSAQAHYNLGLVYQRRGNPSGASRHFARAVELDPLLKPARDLPGQPGSNPDLPATRPRPGDGS